MAVGCKLWGWQTEITALSSPSAEKEISLKSPSNAKRYFENIFLYSREIFVLRVAEEIISLGREEQTVGQKIFEFGFYY